MRRSLRATFPRRSCRLDRFITSESRSRRRSIHPGKIGWFSSWNHPLTVSGRPQQIPPTFRCLSTASLLLDGDDEGINDDSSSDSHPPHHTQPLFTSFSSIVDGPPLQLGFGKIANQTTASVVGRAGSTVLLTTAASSQEQLSDNRQQQKSSSVLTVDYRQRYHGVGNIPMTNRNRRDNAQPSTAEILGARAVDRALRPCLLQNKFDDSSLLASSSTHVHASVQSYPLQQNSPATYGTVAPEVAAAGHPVAMAINTASAALYHPTSGEEESASLLTEPVAAVCWGISLDGTLIQDPTPYTTSELLGTLLYAGTRDRAVMMEWTSTSPDERILTSSRRGNNNMTSAGLSKDLWPDLLHFAQASLAPTLDTIEEFSMQRQQSSSSSESFSALLSSKEGEETVDHEEGEEAFLRKSLGLPPPSSTSTTDALSDTTTTTTTTSARPTRQERMQEAIEYCEAQLGDSLALLFGGSDDGSVSSSSRDDNETSLHDANHHDGNNNNLMSKKLRGRREALMNQEVDRVLQEFLGSKVDDEAASGAADGEEEDMAKFRTRVIHALFKRALCKAAFQSGSRADGRGPPSQGWKTVRPILAQSPALPEVVHGSALFARGDTQVLCSVTLGPPRHGATPQDTYEAIKAEMDYKQSSKATTDDASRAEYNAMPVGSIRFLRTQEAMVSDLNSRKVQADKERTGESGSLAEVKRAFLQYDFPSYSTGELPRGSVLHNRRAIGHGALAERAILPVLPTAHDFPYAIRMTAEVTDSNGSSSMASVCGSVLALLDAGVPLTEPVAGVSVGLAMDEDDEDAYSLLLDITGTEDHYGAMDFKIAGTRDGVTAVQLDVKRPLSVPILLDAMQLARSGRGVILDQMEAQTQGLRPRPEPKESAPRVEVVRFHPSRKRDLIGPGGVVLRQLEDRYGVSIDLTQEGQCLLFGSNREMVSRARSTVMDLVADVVEGEVYEGTVLEVKDFGALVELLRNKEGILHVSEVTDEEEAGDHPDGIAGFVREHLRVGEKVEVLCIGVDPLQGSIKLSRRALLDKTRQRT